MKYLPGPHQTIHQNYYKIVSFLYNEITKHQEEWNPDDPRDYIDTYLAEMKKVILLPFVVEKSKWPQRVMLCCL